MPDMPLPELSVSPSLRHQLVEHLREQIIAGTLRPGASLTPKTLAKQLRTSPMPVREALRVLEEEGLVEVSARRFTRVATPRREVADEAYPLLGLLEGFSLTQGPSPASALAAAQAANEALASAASPSDRLSADIRFHRAITALAKPMASAVLLTLYGRIALLEAGYHRTYRPDISVAEHNAVLWALRDGDAKSAAKIIQQHWQRGYLAILPLFDDMNENPETASSVRTPRPSVEPESADDNLIEVLQHSGSHPMPDSVRSVATQGGQGP